MIIIINYKGERWVSGAILFLKLLKYQADVMSPKTKGVAYGNVNFLFPRLVWDIVKIAFWIGVFVVYGGVDDTGMYGHYRG